MLNPSFDNAVRYIRKITGHLDLVDKFRDKFGIEGEIVAARFLSSPYLHGKFTEGGKADPGYFGGLPYAYAFGAYFMRSALTPEKREENFELLARDIDKACEHILTGNPTIDILRRITILNRATWESHYDYYPTRQYMEGTISPFLLEMGIDLHQATKSKTNGTAPDNGLLGFYEI